MGSNKEKDLHVSVILPGYTEGRNLRAIVIRIFRLLDDNGLVGECIVINDDSGNGVEPTCQELALEYDLFRVIRDNVRGYSNAVICGLRQSRGNIIVVVEPDLSNSVDQIPQMIRLVENGAEFVSGSIYHDDRENGENQGTLRKFTTMVASLPIIFLTSLKHQMSGFFCIPRRTLEACKELTLSAYDINIEVIVKSGAKMIVEMPINASRRKYRYNRMNLKDLLYYLLQILNLCRFKFIGKFQFVSFLIVGFSGLIVDTIFYFLLQYVFGLSHVIARAVSFFIAASWNWYWNRVVTFMQSGYARYIFQWAQFLVMSLISFFFNWGAYYILTTNVGYFNIHKYSAFLFGVIVGAGSNFTFSKYIVFRGSRESIRVSI